MAFNSSNDAPDAPNAPAPGTPATLSPGPSETPAQAAPAPEPGAVTSDNPQSAAFVRFGSCRWQQPAENGTAAFCTHREVKPYAGMQGFDPNAWCSDCQYYKLRRAPKKRSPSDDYTY